MLGGNQLGYFGFFFFWCKKVWESCARVLEFVLVCRVCCNVGGDGHCAQQGQCCRVSIDMRG